MNKSILTTLIMAVGLLGCRQEMFTSVTVLGTIPAGSTVSQDFAFESSGYLPRLSIAALPRDDENLSDLTSKEVWPSEMTMVFCDPAGTVLELQGTPDDGGDRMTEHREAFLWGDIVVTRYPERIPVVVDGDFSFWDELLPNGTYSLQVSWESQVISNRVDRYEIAFVEFHHEGIATGLVSGRYQESLLNQ
jgi:hypothetical protein